MQGAGSPLTDWINSDVEKAKIVSIIMIIFAAWAGIEAISNVAGIEIPPETGMATNVDPDDTQRTNNGVIVGLGAVLGTVGIIIQMSIPRGTEEEEEIVEEGPKFDEDLVKLTKWLCSRGTTTAQFFEWADVDNSGSIDMVEFANALRQAEIANLPPWEIEELVKIMDINEDGRINLPELDIMLLKIQNTLGIDFVPYVTEDEEVSVEEAEDESEDEVAEEEAEAGDDSTEDDAEEETEGGEENAEKETAEDDAEEETEESTEESEDEAAEEEAEAEDGEEDAEEETAEDDAEEETEESTEESEDEAAEEEAEAEDGEEDAEEETAEDEAEESEDEVAEEETEAEDDSTEEETEDETVVEEPPKKKKKF